MKTAIIYKSFTGVTRQYAEWLAEAVNGDVLTYRQATPGKLAAYDAYVIMSGTYISWMPLASFLRKRWEMIRDKKVAVIAVGVIPPEDKGSIISYERIPEYIRPKIMYWKLPGKMGNKDITNIGPVARENLQPVIEYLESEQ